MSIETRKVSRTGVGVTDPILIRPVNNIRAILVVKVTGAVSYDIQYSVDGVFYITLNGNAGITASSDATVVMPVQSVRVQVNSGSGSVELAVRQTDGGFGG
jgi:hypothetical protein